MLVGGGKASGREENGKWKSQMTDKAQSAVFPSASPRAPSGSLSAGEFVKAFLPLSAKSDSSSGR